MAITLFVGDCTKYLADLAKNFDPSAYLIETSNYKNFLNQSGLDVTVYTSFADLPNITRTDCVFYQVLQKADAIYFHPPAIWSDHTDQFSLHNMQQITEYFLYLLQHEKNNVTGLDLSKYKQSPYLHLRDYRSNSPSNLWIAGCSVTAGVGVDPKERWPVLVAQNFQGKFSDLSKYGSSIEFAADQILRSDIRSDDLVIWGLTSEYRAPVWTRRSQECTSIIPHGFNFTKTNQADDIVDETRLYKATVAFAQVENFCQKIGANLIAVPLLCSEALQLLLHDHASYYQLPYITNYIDLGSDKLHPGPLQHKWYADKINDIIEKYGLCATTR